MVAADDLKALPEWTHDQRISWIEPGPLERRHNGVSGARAPRYL